jgi:hypothetical protein
VKVIGVDYESGSLIVTLDPLPNPQWILALQNIGAFSWSGGANPRSVKFHNGKAVMIVTPNSAEQVLGFFHQWVVTANQDYRNRLRQEADRRREEQRRRLERERQQANERAQVLAKLRQRSFS